ncbi:MAG: hypothetical protein S4CHLAM81_03630 [Chlamydiales bacterium]|nr:hypothetical protein [Chlamydiales bacterium]MCH9635152.1 hypothetical protein [Chlamydiales bacterium]MCH9703273.1 hypothetical protein [Chlamydiota bacterium]
MTEVVQPQQPLNLPQQMQEFHTPEEIMVTLLAQTIIITLSRPAPKMELTEERPFNMDGPKEKESEKSKSKERLPLKGRVMPQESGKSEARSVARAVNSTNPERSEKQQQPQVQRSTIRSAEKQLERSLQQARGSFLPTAAQTRAEPAPKPMMPPPPTSSAFRKEGDRVLEEQGSNRRAPPQEQRVTTPYSSTLFERKVDKDREEQKEKQQFAKGRAKKISGSKKVERVAQNHFSPPPASDYESFLRTMMQDSELSDYFGTRVSHFDVMALFIELMKLEVEDNHNERISRLEERRYQIEWMEGVVKQYKQQAKFLLIAGVGAGVLGVLSGALPIIGHVKGDFILSKLGTITKRFASMKRTKMFDSMSKMCFSMAEMNKAMGQVQSSFCDGERSWAEHKSSLHRTDGEESSRVIEERTREFKTWNDVLAQLLRMEQDLARQLYS